MNRALALSLIPLTMALTLSACAGTPEPESTEPLTVPQSASHSDEPADEYASFSLPRTVEKDRDRWTLPTDPYLGAEAASLYSHAESLLTAQCMEEAGFPEHGRYWSAFAPHAETEAGNGITAVFNETVAAKYGYRLAKDPRDLVYDKVMAADDGLWASSSDEHMAA